MSHTNKKFTVETIKVDTPTTKGETVYWVAAADDEDGKSYIYTGATKKDAERVCKALNDAFEKTAAFMS